MRRCTMERTKCQFEERQFIEGIPIVLVTNDEG